MRVTVQRDHVETILKQLWPDNPALGQLIIWENQKTKLKGLVRYVLTLFPEVEVVVPGLCVLDVHRVRVAGDLLAGHGVNAE